MNKLSVSHAPYAELPSEARALLYIFAWALLPAMWGIHPSSRN
jgi:hypothetical protein